MTVRIAPSILSADFGHLADEIARCEAGGADWIHVDVMDGVFVPNLTFGAKVIETVRKLTKLPIDVHLMVVEPEKYFDEFVSAGANTLSIHQEVSPHLQRQLARIRQLGCKAGVALNPGTALSTIIEVLDDIDLVLIMTVNPGFSGQTMKSECLTKYKEARQLFGNDLLLEIDGGVMPENVQAVRDAGVQVIVAATAVFKSKDYGQAIKTLRG